MKFYLILSVIVFLLIYATYFLGKLYISQKRKNKELEKTVETQKKNVNALVEHAEKKAEIETEKAEVTINLRKAKSEEIDKVLDDIINSNNNRVRDNTQNK